MPDDSGESELCNSMYTLFMHRITDQFFVLPANDIMWLAASSSCHCDFFTMIDDSLEAWVFILLLSESFMTAKGKEIKMHY